MMTGRPLLQLSSVRVSKTGLRVAMAAVQETRDDDPGFADVSNWQLVTMVLDAIGLDYDEL